MSKQFLKLFQMALLTIFAFSLLLPVSAQKPAASASKKSSASTTCDGALDIVPTKAMSFVRKRRPAKGEAKQQTSSAESKALPKPPNN